MGSLDPSPKICIAIVGGGIAGLCLARGLSQYDHLDVQVYEATPGYADVGAGISLHKNAIRAMELIDPAIKETYFRRANSMHEDDEHEMATQVIMAQGRNSGETIAQLGRARGRKTVARKDLLDGYCSLVDAERLHLGKRLVKIEGNTTVTLTFKDGTSAEADCLIGADGIHSPTRKHILGDHPSVEPVNHDRWYRIGRQVPAEEVKQTMSKHLDYVPILCGPRGYFNMMPLDYGRVFSMGMVRQAQPGEDFHKMPPRETFADYDEQCLEMFDLIAKDVRPEDVWNIMDHDPAPIYAKGNVVMIGDAAHATGPFIGNGAAQAIEDAAALHAIFAHVHDANQIRAAFLGFDEVRRPRSQRVSEICREMGRFYAYDFGGLFTADSDIEDLRNYCKTIAAYTNEADVAQQNKDAVAAYTTLLSAK